MGEEGFMKEMFVKEMFKVNWERLVVENKFVKCYFFVIRVVMVFFF